MAATSELLALDDVYTARERIAGRLHRTPMLSSRTLSEHVGVPVHFKAELFQRTGAFKPRGVLNKLATLTDEEKARGVISISAGNHAQALAYASALEGIDALVVMWQTASQMKIAAARGYGATVDDSPPDIPAAFEWLDQLIAESGRVLIHPYDDPMVMAGQGTVGVESVLVTEEALREAFRFLYTRMKLATEMAGAATAAGLLSGAFLPEPGQKVAAVVSGGNVDQKTAAAILASDEA